jgi:hypothetical protein
VNVRLTLDLDDRLYEVAHGRALAQQRSLGDVVSELALRGLDTETAAPSRRLLGQFAGLIQVDADFDETPHDWLDAIDRPVI